MFARALFLIPDVIKLVEFVRIGGCAVDVGDGEKRRGESARGGACAARVRGSGVRYGGGRRVGGRGARAVVISVFCFFLSSLLLIGSRVSSV